MFQKKVSVESDGEESSKGEITLKKDTDKKKKKKNKNDSDSDSELVTEVRTSKPSQKAGFALLAVSDEDEDTPVAETKEESDNDEVVKVTKNSKKDKGGKKGKKKKKDEEDEEDIEQMLAELEIEYSGGTVVKETNVDNEGPVEEVEDKKKKKKKKKVEKDVENGNAEEVKEEIGDEEEVGTIKSAAQKKKEKKEREKQKKLDAKKTVSTFSVLLMQVLHNLIIPHSSQVSPAKPHAPAISCFMWSK